MKSLRPGGVFVAFLWLLVPAAQADPEPLAGFKSASSAAELESEKAFDASIDPADIGTMLQQLASEPNQVGSPHDKANADYTLAKYKEWGWDAHIETFSVLYPTPRTVSLELVAPNSSKATLLELPLAGDAGKAALPPYNIYGADGDVTADLVYVNFGMPEDYLELARRGIDVTGKAVIARYGGGWRGLKAKLAHEHGAVACIIYSDPHEDGYFAGDVYPKGGWRTEDGVQRGGVSDVTQYTGDPLTPGVGSTPDAARLKLEDVTVFPKIVVLPISYGDAKPLLAALDGPVAPASWRGSLPVTYHIGPGPAKVHVVVASDWGQKTIFDVIAVMQGSTYPNQWVIRGNHHDGWVYGAWDPLAGNSAEMEEAKAIGALVKSGWSPKRTIVYASWDGEEAGLLGSTEWAETHADELKRKAVLYVNSDTNARGLLDFGGSYQFEHLANDVAASVTDPETGASVLDRKRAAIEVRALEAPPSGDDARRMAAAALAGLDIPLTPLGSGSDYTPFLQHLGIASIDLAYIGEGANAGIYHSAYDNYEHFAKFGDPKFAYGVALAETAGRVVLRTADADVIPVRMAALAASLAAYVDEVVKLTESERRESREIHRLVVAGAYKLASDPLDPRAAPADPGEVPRLDFGMLNAAVLRLNQSAKAYDDALDRASGTDFRLPAAEVSELNGLIQGLEQTLLDRRGLPGREWYRHMIYAPGMLTGYGAKTLPGVREAIEQRRWTDAQAYIEIAAATYQGAAKRMDEAARQLVPRLGSGPASASRGPTPTPPPDS